ncbi:tetratricopeptide repeat protein [Ferruginibacter albus]|uniref:tetratricopeptide repeat protein n=1 Tax=Ferruginibacter albus TaxID=2875540 RepID=UPI001CC6D96D|nr:tetratricopeptide repeat protein [Ferruginibacter albus]UAY52085.1 tetratricopeptide repeat protein [Ferruginibacter albus]
MQNVGRNKRSQIELKKRHLISLLFCTSSSVLFITCKSQNNSKQEINSTKAISINLPYSFKSAEAESLSIKAFDFSKEKKYSTAIDLYHQAIRIEPDNPKLFFDISNCYENVGNLIEALLMLDTAISLDKANPNFYSNRGLIYWKLYKDSSAISDYQEAIKLDSSNWVVYANLTIAYYTNNNMTKSCETLIAAKKWGLTTSSIDMDEHLKKIEDLCK